MNPLEKYYRIPGIQITLPSKGYFNNRDTIMQKDVDVYPFTTTDELYLVNPDSLLNGTALVKLVESCVPAIKINPFDLPMEDINAILIAAKYSTYGDNLDIESPCPKCNTKNKASISIRSLLRNMRYYESDNCIELNGLIFFLNPLTLENTIKIQMAEIQRLSFLNSLLDDEKSEEERSKLISPSIASMIHTAIDVICMGIEKIVILEDNTHVTDKNIIKNFIENAPSSITKELRNKQDSLASYGIDKNVHLKCASCDEQWDTKLDVDPTSFFGQNS